MGKRRRDRLDRIQPMCIRFRSNYRIAPHGSWVTTRESAYQSAAHYALFACHYFTDCLCGKATICPYHHRHRIEERLARWLQWRDTVAPDERTGKELLRQHIRLLAVKREIDAELVRIDRALEKRPALEGVA